jgi:hypothetical protein
MMIMKKILQLIATLAVLWIMASCSPVETDTVNGGNNVKTTTTTTTTIPVPVTFMSAVQSGGTSGTVDSTSLTLTFDTDPVSLTIDNISVTGAKKKTLSGTGTERVLSITDISVMNGSTVTAVIANPAGFEISGSSKSAVVYRLTVANMTIGMAYRGGKIAYILKSGDPEYDASVPHGLIAAIEDQSSSINWSLEANWLTLVPGGTETALGTGPANTEKIIAQNGADVTYAAGLARAYDGGGYTDWFLPSKDELNKLYLNRAAIGGFVQASYWTSTESTYRYAFGQFFNMGSQSNTQKYDPNPSHRLRAVRRF